MHPQSKDILVSVRYKVSVQNQSGSLSHVALTSSVLTEGYIRIIFKEYDCCTVKRCAKFVFASAILALTETLGT